MYRVLLLCKDNSILSPLADGYFRLYGGEIVEIYSAGLEKKKVNPLVVDLMKEDALDISEYKQHLVSDFRDIDFDYILTFDTESEKESHHLPSKPVKYHYDFDKLIPEDFSNVKKEDVYRNIRNRMKKIIKSFVRSHFTQTNAG